MTSIEMIAHVSLRADSLVKTERWRKVANLDWISAFSYSDHMTFVWFPKPHSARYWGETYHLAACSLKRPQSYSLNRLKSVNIQKITRDIGFLSQC